MADVSYKLTMPFLTDREDWTLGFEAGLLYGRLRAGEPFIQGLFHRVNDEQIFLMAARMGYEAEWEAIDETWLQATFEKRDE